MLAATLALLLAGSAPAQTTLRPAPGDDLQAALDGAPAGPVLVELAAGDYPLPRPLWVRRNDVAIRGRGPRLTRIVTPPYDGTHGVFVCGDTPLSGDERPANPLDGARVAYRLPFGRNLCGWAGGSALHATKYLEWDAWAGMRQWTLEAALVFHADLAGGRRLLGIDAGQAVPSPWLLQADGTNYLLRLKLTTGAEASVSWPMGDYRAGVQRLTVTIDLDAGTAAAWSGPDPLIPAVVNLPAGSKLAPNDDAPFYAFGDADITACGLRWQGGARYLPGGRIDAGDGRFFESETANPFALFCRTDAGFDSGRWVRAKAGYCYECLAILEPYHADPGHTVSGFRLEGVSVTARNRLGQAVSLGPCYDPRVSDCRLEGGAHGVGSAARLAVAYVVAVRDCWLDGADACYSGWAQILRLSDLRLGYGGRRLVRLVSCSGSIRDVMTSEPPAWCECYLSAAGSDDDNLLVVTNFGVDDESGRPAGGPFRAPVLLDPRGAGAWTVAVRDTLFPAKGDRPVFSLAPGPAGRPCKLIAGNVRSAAPRLADGAAGRWALAVGD